MMRFFLVAIALFSLAASAAAAHHRHRGAVRKSHHKAHAKKHHTHNSVHAKHHKAKHHTASYAEGQRQNQQLLEMIATAEAELSDASRRLEEVLMDEVLNATVADSAPPALRGAAQPANSSAKRVLDANLTTSLKLQQGKLGDLFKHLKSNIAEFNKREADQKKDNQVYAKRLKKRLEEEKKRLQDPKLSEFEHELLVNRTKTEEHELKFWTRGRSLEHDMFHSNLKLTHGLMSHVKTVMEAYKQMLATGKVDPKLTEALHQASSALPKALIQKKERIQKDVRKLNKHLKISARLLHRK